MYLYARDHTDLKFTTSKTFFIIFLEVLIFFVLLLIKI